MSRKRYTPEQIIGKLREAEVVWSTLIVGASHGLAKRKAAAKSGLSLGSPGSRGKLLPAGDFMM